jgi:hypothetical protein
MTMSQERCERFARARLYGDASQAAQLERDAFFAAIDLAIVHEWNKNAYVQGREIIRHAARMALTRHIAPELWAECKYCPASKRGPCAHCGGTRSLLISEGQLAGLSGIPFKTFTAVWRPRIDAISRVIGTWYQEGQG